MGVEGAVRRVLGALRRPGIAGAFARSLFAVLVVAALASLVAEGVLFYLIAWQGQEMSTTGKQVIAVEGYAKENALALLSGEGDARGALEGRARDADGLGYALLDTRGRSLAATPGLGRDVPIGRLVSLVEDAEAVGGRVREAVPLVQDGEVGGYLMLEYPQGNAAIGNARKLGMSALVGLTALLPVAFLAGATFFFARRIGRRFGEPIAELRSAVEKIRHRDLDFTVGYRGKDEIGELCRAFEELRGELEGSLEREWRGRQDLEDTIATLSHDLRNPAAVIRGHVEALSRVRDEEKRAERLERYLPVLNAASRRMAKLLDGILLAASPELDTTPDRPRPVRLSREIARKAKTYKLLAEERRITFSFETPSRPAGDDGVVVLDLEAFERVLDNLFENALRFTPEGGGISLETSWDERELEVAVRDTGPGLDPEDLARVFEKGYRGKRDGAHRGDHSGLGLYISRLLVRRNGGRIHLKNLTEGGLEATFSLPLAEARGPRPVPASEGDDEPTPVADNRKR